MAQVPYMLRYVRREVTETRTHETVTRVVPVLQQFIPVKQFSESKGRIVEFWKWTDVPLCDEASGAVLEAEPVGTRSSV